MLFYNPSIGTTSLYVLLQLLKDLARNSTVFKHLRMVSCTKIWYELDVHLVDSLHIFKIIIVRMSFVVDIGVLVSSVVDPGRVKEKNSGIAVLVQMLHI